MLLSLLTLLVLASHAKHALSCSCEPTVSSDSPLQCILRNNDDRDMVFRGKVVRDVSHTSHDGQDANAMQAYIVQVERVIKGCGGAVKALDRVVVASPMDPNQCGAGPFTLNSSHIFTADNLQPVDEVTRAQLGNRSKAKHLVWADSCGFNQAWGAISSADKALLQSYEPICSETTFQRR